ncbi:MAG: Ig-like domain-containing protein [Bacteroidota bacterium]
MWGRSVLAALLFPLLLSACATPSRPTGGPDDTTPPRLVGSIPEAGALGVTEREVTLEFSERINPRGVRTVTVVPESETAPEVEIRGRELRITLDSLREATTYVVTVSTDLSDQRGVALTSPITLAFSTGDRLDQGTITGRLLSPTRGEPAPGLAVWAYRADSTGALPDPREQTPDYGTQSGSDGTFALEYLREGPYFVVAVDDRNRNRRADPGERFAAPPQSLTEADSLGSAALTLYTALRDSVAPAPQRTRGISPRRLAVRFDEVVLLDNVSPDSWALTDSASGMPAPIRAVYVDPVSPQEVRLETEQPLSLVPHRIALAREGSVRDSAGNSVAPFTLTVMPSERADDSIARLSAFLPESRVAPDSALTLRSDQRAGVRFTLPPDSSTLAALAVTREGQPVEFTTRPLPSGLGVLVEVPLEVRRFAVAVPVGDSTQTRRYRRPASNETGELAGRVTGTESAVIVEAVPATGEPYRTTTDGTGAFRFAALPPGDYRLRLVVDTDGDGAWTGGRLAPYVPPEAVAFSDAAQTVRARFETDVGEIAMEE